jgi:hypothetical protein
MGPFSVGAYYLACFLLLAFFSLFFLFLFLFLFVLLVAHCLAPPSVLACYKMLPTRLVPSSFFFIEGADGGGLAENVAANVAANVAEDFGVEFWAEGNLISSLSRHPLAMQMQMQMHTG